MSIKLLDAFKFYKALPGQVKGIEYLDSLLTEQQRENFAKFYRDNPPPPLPAATEIYLLMTYSGEYQSGFRKFNLDLMNGDRRVDRVAVLSGAGFTQDEAFVKPSQDYSGSMRCLPEGIYELGPVEDAGAGQSWGAGLGRWAIELKPKSPIGGRSALFIHLDANKASSPGSAGCVCPFNDGDIYKIMGWLQQKTKPTKLICDLGMGTIPSKKPEPVSPAATTLPSKVQIDAIFGHEISENLYADMIRCFQKFQINSRDRICHFLAQVAHESGGGQWLEEFASGDAYEGRADLGNTQPGDGRKYKGAGLIQLTGRANYQAFADYMKDPKIMEGVKVVAAVYPCSSAGFYWHRNGMNALCDRGDSCRKISARVNGRDPANGLAERERYYAKAQEVIL